MKLLNRFLECGGKKGCGERFEFKEGTTVEEASKVFGAHRSDPNHDRDAFKHQNRNRLVDGLAPLTLEEWTLTGGEE